MSNSMAKFGSSAEQKKELWRKQNIADLLEWADRSLTDRLRALEGLTELARSMNGGALPDSPDEHDEHGRLKTSV